MVCPLDSKDNKERREGEGERKEEGDEEDGDGARRCR